MPVANNIQKGSELISNYAEKEGENEEREKEMEGEERDREWKREIGKERERGNYRNVIKESKYKRER